MTGRSSWSPRATSSTGSRCGAPGIRTSRPFSGVSDLPALSAAQLSSLHAALGALDDAVDAVADLLTAESVFQAVRGNPAGAAASLDAMAQGVLPPRPEVARTPAGGTSFTQRLVVALDASATPDPGPWGPRTPRALAEPFLDNWAGTLLGPPAQAGCRVRFPDASVHEVTLDQLALRPLDFVALARTPPAASGDGELDRRVLQAAAAPDGAQVVYDASSAPVTFTAALELARTLGELLAAARPLLPADLVAPDTDAPAPGPGRGHRGDRPRPGRARPAHRGDNQPRPGGGGGHRQPRRRPRRSSPPCAPRSRAPPSSGSAAFTRPAPPAPRTSRPWRPAGRRS